MFRADEGVASAWNSYSLSDTNVQQTANGVTMIYRSSAFSGGANIELAGSLAGITWQRSAANPVITHKMIGTKINFVSYLRHLNKDYERG